MKVEMLCLRYCFVSHIYHTMQLFLRGSAKPWTYVKNTLENTIMAHTKTR